MDASEIQRVAERMLADYDARRPNELFAERGTDWLTLDDAYAVQRAMAKLRRARGERCLGYKVGCVSPAVQNQLNLRQPVRGFLWDTEVHVSECRLSKRNFVGLAVEGEIALRLRQDISTKAISSLKDLTDCLEYWFPVIELHNRVFRGPKPTSQELVAGNAMHAGFVAAPGSENPCVAALAQAAIRVEIDGKLAETSNVASLPGGPLGSLRWLAFALAREGQTLKAGDVVLTGSPGRLVPVRAGSAVSVTSEGQSVRFFAHLVSQSHRTSRRYQAGRASQA
ncbi:MAG: hypothetical protein HYY23_16720 [Verrucomicrobia bacterium]|nr:hypothetical protein [Verrucomicrobiota bacterium]